MAKEEHQKEVDKLKELELAERPKQTNCQNEPHYPGHETVVFAFRYPDVYMGNDCNIKKWE